MVCGGSSGSLFRLRYDVASGTFTVGRRSSVAAMIATPSDAGAASPGFALLGRVGQLFSSLTGGLGGGGGSGGGMGPVTCLCGCVGLDGTLRGHAAVYATAGGVLAKFALPGDKPVPQVGVVSHHRYHH